MSTTYTIHQVQMIDASIEETWNFFSNPRNLARITPASLDFKITTIIDGDEIFKGQVITYQVRPLLGIAVKWVSEITEVQPLKLFIDEQRKGPYKLWHHEHHFKAVGNRTEMTDIINYQIPFGMLGSLGRPVVKSQLDKIFSYRKEVVENLFNGKGKTGVE